MNPPELTVLARKLNLDAAAGLRLAFGIACIGRVRHLLTDLEVIQCLETGEQYCQGQASELQLEQAARVAAQLAQTHPGSGSIDGAGNAAVSVSFGVAAALAGRALEVERL